MRRRLGDFLSAARADLSRPGWRFWVGLAAALAAEAAVVAVLKFWWNP